jgi:regulatory protein
MPRSDAPRSQGAAAEEEARQKCLRLLSRRPRSMGELRERLATTGIEDRVIEEVLVGLEEAGLVDDEDFTRSWVASRKAAGGAGRRKLRWELRRKGVDRELVERILDEELDEETELQAAAALARKRVAGRGVDRQELSRLRRYLLGRGFAFETVDSVLAKIAGQEGD